MEDLLQKLELKLLRLTAKVAVLEMTCATLINNSSANGRPAMSIESFAHKRRRRASSFDKLARRFFTRNEQLSMTSVIGESGKRENGFCSNGCCSKTDGRRKLGQRNMVIRQSNINKVKLGKWCYRCIAKSGIRKKRTLFCGNGKCVGGYVCTQVGCQEEGVGAQIDADGRVIAGSLTCGCNWGADHDGA